MKTTLTTLHDYQTVLSSIADLDHTLSFVPPEIEALEKEWKSIQNTIEGLRVKKAELNSRLEKTTASLDEANTKSEKFEKDLHEVTNSKEYHAVLKEIDMAKKQINSLSDDIVGLESELESADADLIANTEAEKQACSKYQAAVKDQKEAQHEKEIEREQQLKIKAQLEEKLPPKLLKQFQRIASRRNGVGLSLCVSAVCRSCNIRVRQNVIEELRLFKRIITCESCKRILYFADSEE